MKVLRLLDKFLCSLGKSAIFLVVGIGAIYICFVVFVYAATWLWPAFYGSYSLGNNIYMLEGDGGNMIVHGTTIRGNTCYSGLPLIPTCENQYGWTMGYNNASYNKKMDNLLRSVGSSIKSLWDYFAK